MGKQNLKSQTNLELDEDEKMRTFLTYYIDLISRGLIALCISLSLILFISWIFPAIPNWYFLPIIFIMSLMLSPVLSKIKVAHYFVDRYIIMLNNIVYKLNKFRKIDGTA